MKTETLQHAPFQSFDAPELTAQNPGFDHSIGGSCLAAILGVSPWESPYERWLKLTGKVGPTPDNPAMARGRKWEPVIADIFQAAHPEIEVTQNNPVTLAPWFVRDTNKEYLTGQPDRMLHDPNGRLVAGLEIKTASVRTMSKWGAEGTDQVPQGYLLQSNWYAGLMGVKSWKLFVLFFAEPNAEGVEMPTSTREYNIDFDSELYGLCYDRAVDFWENYVLPDVAPEQTNVGETFIRYVKEAFPRNVEPMAQATADEEAVMQSVIDAKLKADAAAKEFELEKAKAQAVIGDRDGLFSETLGKITWKCSKDRENIDYKGLIAELKPEHSLIEKYTSVKPGSRTFLVSPKKN